MPGGPATVGPTIATHVTVPSELEGWHVEELAAQIHCREADDAYSTEYYEPSDCVLCWRVKGGGEVAVPVGRDTVPDPLHEHVRQDLVEAGVDPEAEDRVA